MTSISTTQRLMQTAQSQSKKLSDAMKTLSEADIHRAVEMQMEQQANSASMKLTMQRHWLTQRKILEEMR